VVSTADPIWRFHSLPVTRRRSCAIREEEALNVEVSRCGVNDQGWKEGKSTVCAECELLVSLWILDLGLCPSRQKQVRMQGHCKPLGVEPGYLQTRRAKTARKAFVCQDHPSGRTPFLSRWEGRANPLVERPSVPDRQANILGLPYPNGKLSAGAMSGEAVG
jgi:hypothetical protein